VVGGVASNGHHNLSSTFSLCLFVSEATALPEVGELTINVARTMQNDNGAEPSSVSLLCDWKKFVWFFEGVVCNTDALFF
jgi:hypothetical protein